MVSTEIEPLEPRSSLIQVKIGGRFYDAQRVPQCNTCTHPARGDIELMIIQNHAYRDIAQRFSGTEYEVGGETRVFPEIGYMSIYRHFERGHLPVEAAALRQIVDERAKDMGVSYDEQTAAIVDGYTLAKQVLYRTHEGLADGSLRPSVQDGLAAAKLLKEFEQSAGGQLDAEAWSQAMMRYFEIAQQIMPGEMWERFASALSTDPVLAAIRRRLEAGQDDAIEGEFTEGDHT